MESDKEFNTRGGTESWPVTLDRSGRIFVPIELRRSTGWGSGTDLVIVRDNAGDFKVMSTDRFIENVQTHFSSEFGDRDLVAELIEKREQEASLEESSS
ncbi:MAG: hypothetical protein AAGG48_18205 [Planctomycetota bacterium]